MWLRLTAGLKPPDSPQPWVLPVDRLPEVSWVDALLSYPPIKALLPLPLLALVAVPIWWFFRDTWRQLDLEAAESRLHRAATGQYDYRPAACLLITAVVLTVQEYYGGSSFYHDTIRPWLVRLETEYGVEQIRLSRYNELYSYCWWAFARVFGYVFIPLPLWKLLFPRDSLLDMGLRGRGFFQHLWIYGVCLAIVVPVMLLIATQPDFGTYYPFYKNSSRSWLDLMLWEAIYWLQFLALEMFFRGWMLGALRRAMGSAAIFVMAVPYCMIHYGKPYLEAHGAIVAGVVLGSLAMRTRSIYAGFLVHVTVAFLMDILALWRRDALPTTLWPPG